MSLMGLKFPGDVNIQEARVRSSNGFVQDILGQVVQVEVFEDIFSPFITGTLVLSDAIDLVNFFPFIGEEYLSLKIATPTMDSKNRIIEWPSYKIMAKPKG